MLNGLDSSATLVMKVQAKLSRRDEMLNSLRKLTQSATPEITLQKAIKNEMMEDLNKSYYD